MLTEKELSGLLRELEPGAEPDQATLDRIFARIEAERLERRRRAWHRWRLGSVRPWPRVALRGVALAMALSLLVGVGLGAWVGGSKPIPSTAPSIAPSTAPSPLRPPPTPITPTVRVSLAGRPATVVAAEGSIWVANGNRVDRIDPVSGARVDSITVGSSRAGLGAGPAGIWVCDVVDGVVARLDPVSGQMGLKVRVERPEYIAVGVRDVWIASPRTGLVTRIDAATSRVVTSIDAGKAPSQLLVTDDAIWVPNDESVIDTTSQASDRTVTRIDPVSNSVVGLVPNGANFTYARQAMVAAGEIWVLDNGSGRIVRVDPVTNTIAQEIVLGRDLGGMASVGDDIWVTVQASRDLGEVVRVDLAADAVTTSLSVPGSAISTSGLTSLAASGRSLWVAGDWSDAHELLRIDLP